MLHPLRFAPLPMLLCATALLAGCRSTPPAAYQAETFALESPYVSWSTRDPAGACEVGRRALLSQGYQVDSSDPTRIRGDKHFLPKPDHATTLSITLVCLPSNVGAAIYANALHTRYELKSSASSTGVSVAGVGSISLPWASDKEAMIKVGEETISDPDFYKRLFGLIETLQGG